MINLNVSLILISIITQIIMFLILNQDSLVHKDNKAYFFAVFFLLFIQTIGEWGRIYYTPSISTGMVYNLSVFVKYTFAPFGFILISKSYNNNFIIKKYYIVSAVYFVVMMLIFNENFFISYDNKMDFGNLFYFYIGYFIFSFFVMVKNIFITCKNYQSKNIFIIGLIAFTFLFLYSIQAIMREISLFALTGTVSVVFIYAYYTSFIFKIDPLTGMLNRKCFNNSILNIKNDCAIVYLDINKFKVVNDTYGHNFGDKILKDISKIVKQTFSKNCKCFRLSGDEFCIILEKKLYEVDGLINEFNNNIINERKNEPLLPEVAIGYGYYIKGENSIEETINIADFNMYENKNKIK